MFDRLYLGVRGAASGGGFGGAVPNRSTLYNQRNGRGTLRLNPSHSSSVFLFCSSVRMCDNLSSSALRMCDSLSSSALRMYDSLSSSALRMCDSLPLITIVAKLQLTPTPAMLATTPTVCTGFCNRIFIISAFNMFGRILCMSVIWICAGLRDVIFFINYINTRKLGRSILTIFNKGYRSF